MRLRDYVPLVRDGRTIIRTLRQVYGAARSPAAAPARRGQAQRVADRTHPPWIAVRVARIRVETPCTRTFVVEATGGALPPFAAGQYVNLFVEVQGVRTSRPMSISAAPRGDGAMELTIKRKAGGFVSGHLLDALRVGDELQISGPEGDVHFQPLRDGQDLVFVAAGSGIAPFMGMIDAILARSTATRVALLYGSRTADAIIFHDRLRALAARGRLRLRCAVSRPAPGWDGERGRIDAPMIRRFLDGETLAGKTFFVCGPGQMERDARRALEQLGVRRSAIRSEPSPCFEDVTRRPEWPAAVRADQRFAVRIAGRAEPISARAGEPLLSSLERAGISVAARCRSGQCGACRTRLTDGAVVRAAGPGQRGSERAAGFIHACVSHPVSDLRLQLLPDRRLLHDGGRALAASRGAQDAVTLALPAPGVLGQGAVPAAAARTRGAVGKSLLAVAGLGVLLYIVFFARIRHDLLAREGRSAFELAMLALAVAALVGTAVQLLARRPVVPRAIAPARPAHRGRRMDGNAVTVANVESSGRTRNSG